MPRHYSLVAYVALFCAATAAAGDTAPKGLLETLAGEDMASLTGLDTFGLSAGGWATLGFTYNADKPGDRSNGPVEFNNRANEFGLYQLGVFLEKPVVADRQHWSLGGRVEMIYGTDAPQTQATGHWDDGLISENNQRFYDIALPQAYAEIHTPVGNGLNTKIGHFYSILGYESVPSPPNFFVSHSYSMKSSPFTVTGTLSSYAVNTNLTLMAGAVTGPDNFDQHFGAWSFLGGFNVSNDDSSRGFSFAIMDGDVDDTQASHQTYYYSAYRQNLTPKLHAVLQHDYGRRQNAQGNQDAEWYSLVHYLTYDVTETWGVGVRGEWFRDDDGVRYGNGGANYYAVTGGLNWKPNDWLMLRPEVRYDWAQAESKPFDAGNRGDQLLLAIDTVIKF